MTVLIVVIDNFKEHNSIYDLNDNSFRMKVTDIKIDDSKVTYTLNDKETLIGTYYLDDNEEVPKIEYGDLVLVTGTLKEPSNNTVPYAFNYKKYLNNKGIYYLLSIDNIKVIKKNSGLYKVKNFINERINKIDGTGYMKAFILGDKSLIDDDVYSSYQSIGITHLFALSGMHIGLLSTILLKVLKKAKMSLKYIIIDILLVLYGFIVLFPSSIKRCILFYIIGSLNKVFNLNLSNKKILLLVIVILIILDPKIIYETGFQFSICTVGGIILCNKFINDDNKLKSSFKLALVAFLFSLPISLYSFYEVNLLSVFYNMFFVPLVSLIIYPLSLLSFILPVFYNLFYLMIILMEKISLILSSFKLFNIYMSFNLIEIIIFYTGLILVFVKKYRIFIVLLVGVMLIDYLMPYFDSRLDVYYLDVGQGDASLIIFPKRSKVVLIDTGGLSNSSYKVSDNYIMMLKYLGIKNIDYLIISHGDNDHMGDASYLVGKINIKKVIFNCGEFNDLETELVKVLNKKDIKYYVCINELKIDKYKLEFLSTGTYDNENENSNVIYLKYNNFKFLFMGDASMTREEDLLKKYNLDKIDFLKVGHHGSDTSSGEEFISKIEPKYSLISVGKKNRYGHPKASVLDTLEKYGSEIYRTDEDGSIEVKINKNKYKITTYSP